jgi:hypothetical protein
VLIQRLSKPWRLDDWSRPTFHICPHVSHRQYVEESTFSLAVLTFDDPQNGQGACITRPALWSSTAAGPFTFR